jgi:hypothetical protein
MILRLVFFGRRVKSRTDFASLEKVVITAQQARTVNMAVLPLPEATEHLFRFLYPIKLKHQVGSRRGNESECNCHSSKESYLVRPTLVGQKWPKKGQELVSTVSFASEVML